MRDANPVDFPSSRVQDELLVTSDFFLPGVLRRRRLGNQDHRVADVLDNEWVVTQSDGTGGDTLSRGGDKERQLERRKIRASGFLELGFHNDGSDSFTLG